MFYVADRNSDNKFELFSVPIAGGLAAELNEELSSDYDVESAFRASPDGPVGRLPRRPDGDRILGALERPGDRRRGRDESTRYSAPAARSTPTS